MKALRSFETPLTIYPKTYMFDLLSVKIGFRQMNLLHSYITLCSTDIFPKLCNVSTLIQYTIYMEKHRTDRGRFYGFSWSNASFTQITVPFSETVSNQDNRDKYAIHKRVQATVCCAVPYSTAGHNQVFAVFHGKVSRCRNKTLHSEKTNVSLCQYWAKETARETEHAK